MLNIQATVTFGEAAHIAAREASMDTNEEREIVRMQAALRALVGDADAGLYEVAGYKFCAYCHAGHGRWMVEPHPHVPDCPIAVGRALLGEGE